MNTLSGTLEDQQTPTPPPPPMPDESKQVLVEKIKQLLTLDNQLNELKRQKKLWESQKKELSKELIIIMKANAFTTLNTKTDTLQYKVTRTKVLGKRQLTALLNEYYKDNGDKADEVKNYIFGNLKERVTEHIVRKGQKADNQELGPGGDQ